MRRLAFANRIIAKHMDNENDMLSISKAPLNKNCKPINSESIDQQTSNTRNSLILQRGEGVDFAPGGGGFAISKFDVSLDEEATSILIDRKNGKFKIKTEYACTGTEQVALDCETFVQQANDHRPGEMWAVTGAGPKYGVREGNYGTDITVWVDFIPLIRAGILGINILQQGSKAFLDSHPEFRDKKCWLYSLSDAFAKKQEREKKTT